MVLCAGFGTRLRPLSERCAKPLVPVGDRPVLEHTLGKLRGAGFERIVVNAYHRAEDLRAFARAHAEVLLSEEPDVLGTAGGVAHAAGVLGPGDVLVHNGDILSDADLRSLAAAHRGDATLLVHPRAAGEGNVGIDAEGRIVRLRRETVRPGEMGGGDFLGVHVIGGGLRRVLPPRGCLVGDVYLPALREGAFLSIHPFRGAWFDLGTVGTYLDANIAWLAGREAWIGPGAKVAGDAILRSTVVGERAVVDPGVTLERCVVWPGARVERSLADAVITREGIAPRSA
jgi:mannose-1-phosphate guanylyltransferase